MGALFSPANEHFLAQVEQYIPTEVAAVLPTTLSVLILHGEKDQQITDDDVVRLTDALRRHDIAIESDDLANADHVFKDVPGTPNPATDYTNPALHFSPDAATKLGTFIDTVFGHPR